MNQETWNEIKTEQDIENFMKIFNRFHDSCLKELHLWTDHYVGRYLSMSLSGELDCKVRILIQRQAINPSAIELLFEQVTKLNITPSPETYDSLILGASLLKKEEMFYWADDLDWTPDSYRKDNIHWISAKIMKWRDVSAWMGPELRYGPRG